MFKLNLEALLPKPLGCAQGVEIWQKLAESNTNPTYANQFWFGSVLFM